MRKKRIKKKILSSQSEKDSVVEKEVKKPERSDNYKKLQEVARGAFGCLTYHFNDGTYLRTQINSQVFLQQNGGRQSLTEVENIFLDTCADMGAISLEIQT